MSTPAIYEWHIDVQRLDHYGQRVEATFPMVVIAANRSEVTTKVHTAFEAKYDDFRKFWSHKWGLREVREIHAPPVIDHAKEGQ